MKTNLTTCTLLLFVAFAVMAGCAGGPPPKELKLPEPAAPAPAAVAPAGAAQAGVTDPATGMEFVFVKGGCYKMGDTFGDGDADERPVHEVCVSDFYLGKYEVTQGQWEKVMGDNPSVSKQCGPDCPVESVSWNMIKEFITKLNSKSGKQYRLPWEAEWEYASRSGGKEEKWAGTSDEASLGEFAWYEKNSGLMTHRVGLRKANGLGLHDMSGSVSEWCQDWYSETYYKESPKDNPPGPGSGEKRVLRGGSWLYDSSYARTAKRRGDAPAEWDSNYGFRLLLPAR
jgi:formylglycine-generating enzyme required for sulfatase activity